MRVQLIGDGGHFRSDGYQCLALLSVPGVSQPVELGIGQRNEVALPGLPAHASLVFRPAPGGERVLRVFHEFHGADAFHLAVVAAVLDVEEPASPGAPDRELLSVGGILISNDAGRAHARFEHPAGSGVRVPELFHGPGKHCRKNKAAVQGQIRCRTS